MGMQTVQDVMTTNVVYLPSETTLAEAARTMREQDIGDVVVADGPALTGLVTDRDIVVRAVAERFDPASTTIGEIVSKDLVTVRPDDSIQQAVRNGLSKASQTIRNIDWFEVTQIRGAVLNNTKPEFQVEMKVGFRLLDQAALASAQSGGAKAKKKKKK